MQYLLYGFDSSIQKKQKVNKTKICGEVRWSQFLRISLWTVNASEIKHNKGALLAQRK